ncbi:MAG: hypothetical protein KBD55_00760 [Candidatus Pacebacteria bacterium]|nr:hypothetical protein [Candidatus Paceibacterota bacterium]
MENIINNSFVCYIKRVWSKDFDSLKAEVSKIKGIAFEVDEKDKFLVVVPEAEILPFVDILRTSVKGNAWHDAVNAYTIYVVFEDDINKLDINVGAENEVWQKIKSLEEGVRKFDTLKEMIADSLYGQYINYH